MLNRLCKEFGMKKLPLTIGLREAIEDIWLRKDFNAGKIELDGESLDNIGYYELQYSAEQWYGCYLRKIYSDNTYNTIEETVYEGEGDTPFEALIDMTIKAKELLDENDLDILKNMDENVHRYSYFHADGRF